MDLPGLSASLSCGPPRSTPGPRCGPETTVDGLGDMGPVAEGRQLGGVSDTTLGGSMNLSPTRYNLPTREDLVTLGVNSEETAGCGNGRIDGNDDPTPVPPGYHGTSVGFPSSLNYQGVRGVAIGCPCSLRQRRRPPGKRRVGDHGGRPAVGDRSPRPSTREQLLSAIEQLVAVDQQIHLIETTEPPALSGGNEPRERPCAQLLSPERDQIRLIGAIKGLSGCLVRSGRFDPWRGLVANWINYRYYQE